MAAKERAMRKRLRGLTGLIGTTSLVGVLGTATLLGAPFFSQSSDERVAARDVLKKRADAVVMVLATIKIRATVGGREQTVDQAAQTNATILDGTGLAVLSLSALQPDDVMTRSISRSVPPGTKVEVTSDPSDIRMHLTDGRELPVKLVLRDEDLDLAFVRPSQSPAAPLTCVDAPSAKPTLMDLLMIVQRTSENTGWATAASFGSVQLVIDKPRTYYQVAIPTMGGNGLGSPLFDTTGRFVGVLVMRNTGTKGSGVAGVLPADDIREVAKQAK
jgi:S1-C subfamily serine protease